MLNCPFFEEHPELFIVYIGILFLVYLIYYGLYCLVLYLLSAAERYSCKWLVLYM